MVSHCVAKWKRLEGKVGGVNWGSRAEGRGSLVGGGVMVGSDEAEDVVGVVSRVSGVS